MGGCITYSWILMSTDDISLHDYQERIFGKNCKDLFGED